MRARRIAGRPWRDWLTDVDHGAGHLLARVIVNRLWQHHFGRGIVATPSDFGTQGERPTHPELLDWLAGELIRGGWRLKPIHKLIMTSAVYMAGRPRPIRHSPPPTPTTRCSGARRRAGSRPRRSATRCWPSAARSTRRCSAPARSTRAMRRRSVYFTIKRSQLIPMLIALRRPGLAPGPRASGPPTTVAPQALMLMNNPQVREYAAGLRRPAPARPTALARRRRSSGPTGSPCPARRTTTSGPTPWPSSGEQADSYRAAGQAEPLAPALADFCQVLMGLNEFIYIE